jgi:hypothetical protein
LKKELKTFLEKQGGAIPEIEQLAAAAHRQKERNQY